MKYFKLAKGVVKFYLEGIYFPYYPDYYLIANFCGFLNVKNFLC